MPNPTEKSKTEEVTQDTVTQDAPDAVTQSASTDEKEIEEKIVGPLLQAVDKRLGEAVNTLKKDVLESVNTRLEELKAPQTDAEAFLGGTAANPGHAAGIRQGEDVMGSRPYSYWRMYKAVWGVDGAEKEAKLELAISRQLKNYYEVRQFPTNNVRDSFLVPFGSSMLPDDIDDGLSSGNDSVPISQMADMLGMQMVGQRMKGLAQFHEGGPLGSYFKQALSMFDDSQLGIFTDSQITGELIELVRKIEVFSRIGARQITLPPNGYLPMGKHAGAASGFWVGEGATITTSNPTSGKVELRAKKAAGLVIVPNELFRFSTRDTEAFLRADLARVLALLVDLAGLEGLGTSVEPLGIIKRGGITTKVAGTTGTNGDTLEPNDPSGLMAEIEELDHDIDSRGFAWLMRGKMWQNILNRRADAVSANDEAGAYLFAINREAIQNGMPGQMLGHPVIRSGQISQTRVKGTGTDLTYILGGIPDDIVIGRIGVLEFTLGTEGTVASTNLFETDQAAIRAIEHADFAMRNENSWAIIDNLDMDLPSGVI